MQNNIQNHALYTEHHQIHTNCSTENHFKIPFHPIHSVFTEYELSALYQLIHSLTISHSQTKEGLEQASPS